MKKLLLGTITALTLTGVVAIAAFASPAAPYTTGVTTNEAQAAPEQFRIQIGIPYNEASPTAIPVEKARQLGLEALAEFFGADLSKLVDYEFEMGYGPGINVRESMMSAPMLDMSRTDERGEPAHITIDDLPDYRFPMNVYRSTWHGTIVIPNDRTPCPEGFMLRGSDLFRFTLDAQTGELVGLQFFPSEDPIARPYKQSECMGSAHQVFAYRDNMTAQQNTAFAIHAMELVEEAGIFESDVLRASVGGGGWMMGRDNSFELVIGVFVESVNGETVSLTFQGSNRKELVGVHFYTRTIDYAVDRDGNIAQPISQFVGNPTISHWIYR